VQAAASIGRGLRLWRPTIIFLLLLPALIVSALPTPLDVASQASLAAAAGDPVIAAAGDIACDPLNGHFNGGNGASGQCAALSTSNLLVNGHYAAELPLGDTQYYCGGYSAFLQSYQLSWGRLKSTTHPVVGNHEYLTSGGTGCDPSNTAAAGYFKYFGSAAGQQGKGYYSFNVGAWHLIALNSNCGDAGGCSTTSPQYAWLANDLAAHRTACTLAYWHIPLFSSGAHAEPNMRSIWKLLAANNVDLVLSGHDHDYERFAPQTYAGVLDNAHGIRSFVVGTGGSNHTAFVTTAANSQRRNATTYGILQLTLHANGFDWRFIPAAGGSFSDSGSATCH
jgi:hypothetical protein